MAEIRRKLVIVGDGACGKTCLLMFVRRGDYTYIFPNTILTSAQCLLQGNIPRGSSHALPSPVVLEPPRHPRPIRRATPHRHTTIDEPMPPLPEMLHYE